jgi:hypothetical protein
MRLFFHHVGLDGARRDFPRTVFSDVQMSVAEDNIPENNPFRQAILSELKNQFPEGHFNCWGVPDGAHTVIQHLEIGDVVLLIETTQLDGSVPALCEVKVFYPHELSLLSKALWLEFGYPYIFFFRTERLSLSWTELREQLGYSERFDPRGKFYSVDPLKPLDFKGHADYVEYLRKNYRT